LGGQKADFELNFKLSVLEAQKELGAQIWGAIRFRAKYWKSDVDFPKSDVDFPILVFLTSN